MLKLEVHHLDLIFHKYYNFLNGVHLHGDSHQGLQYCVVLGMPILLITHDVNEVETNEYEF